MSKYKVIFKYQIIREVEAENEQEAVKLAEAEGQDEFEFVAEEVIQITKFWNEA